MTATAEKQSFTFQAEIKQLLHLLAHSLYQSREIALRELISNASDALDKMRYLSLSEGTNEDAASLAIELVADEEAGTLAIADNGIGMTKEELVKNLGTIAHSGSLSFLNTLTGDAKKDLSLIGQFGVGFYSAFMLADRVRVLSQGYKEESGWEWESEGTGSFTVSPAEGLERGTRIVLHLKEDAKEFLKDWRLKEVVRKYSSFVAYPIKLKGEVLNSAKPIWVEPKSKLTEEQYHGFYGHLTHRADEKPLWHLHLSVDSPIQFHSILYCPPTNVELLGFGRTEHGLVLCAKRILVQNDCRELLPEYLRFLYGIVDSEDLPLNVSRETLQDNIVFRKIKSLLVKRTLERLSQLAEERPEEYLAFYRQFGSILREGINSEFEHRSKLAKLLRFPTSALAAPDALTSLEDYVKRSPEGQKQIYYIGGPDRTAIEKSPNLEIFRKRGLEVLYLIDPIDEFVVASLGEFEGKTLRPIDAADLELPEGAPEEEKKEEDKVAAGELERVIDLFKRALGDRVSDVRRSNRLTDSPCCLVNADAGMSAQMQKLLQMTNKNFTAGKRILEINASSPLIGRLAALSANPDHNGFIETCGEQLYASALLLEGQCPEPRSLVDRVERLMEEAAEKRSPIIFR